MRHWIDWSHLPNATNMFRTKNHQILFFFFLHLCDCYVNALILPQQVKPLFTQRTPAANKEFEGLEQHLFPWARDSFLFLFPHSFLMHQFQQSNLDSGVIPQSVLTRCRYHPSENKTQVHFLSFCAHFAQLLPLGQSKILLLPNT